MINEATADRALEPVAIVRAVTMKVLANIDV